MLHDFSIESVDYHHLFDNRYLILGDFVKLCALVGLRNCNETELEDYEKNRLMFPAARVIMPDNYARAFWSSHNKGISPFKFDDEHLPFHKLDWELRYKISKKDQGDFRHPIDKFWGVDGLERPSEKEFVDWKDYLVKIEEIPNKRSKVSHYFSHWQIYELHAVRKSHLKMYMEDYYFVRSGIYPSNNVNELSCFFDASSWFYTLYKASSSYFFREIQPNNDGVIILDQKEQNKLTEIFQKIAFETIKQFRLDETALQTGLRKMMELHFDYEEAERYKLSVALKKDILIYMNLMSYATGKSSEEISQNAGPVGNYVGNYLEILFPNRRKVVREKAIQLVRVLLQRINKSFQNVGISDYELTNLFTYIEETNISWFELEIIELNDAFFEQHSLKGIMTFLPLKTLSTFPETLVKVLIQNNGDEQTQEKFRVEKNPGMVKVLELLFCDTFPIILQHYKNAFHWTAKTSDQFLENLTHFSEKIKLASSKDEYIGENLALTTLIRNFSNHIAVEDPKLFEGQYIFCLQSILISISSIWKAAQLKQWV